MIENHREALSQLDGMRLVAVESILDYLVLRFEDADEQSATLTCDVLPAIVSADGRRLPAEAPRYSESLRHLIGADVLSTEMERSGGVRLCMASASIVLDPAPDEVDGPEIATLSGLPGSDPVCWRPGDPGFEHL